jgi:hypothetical protein
VAAAAANVFHNCLAALPPLQTGQHPLQHQQHRLQYLQ